MHVRCPHCQSPIELVDAHAFGDVSCPSCDSRFNLLADETKTYVETKRTIGRFELREELGTGAFGTVWRAKDSELDRPVAVKIPRSEQLSAEETEQFLREARAAAQLRHPNVVSVHEVGRENGRIFIVSDFVDGVSLSDWLTGQRLTSREAAELCATIAEAVDYAHRVGVVHRDLKPANVLVDTDGRPHVTDFGLAKRSAGEVTMTTSGAILGTPAYMSPEQAKGDSHNADARSDVYSLGVMLFELLTGERPFRGNTRMLLHQVLHVDASPPRALNNTIPRDLDTICLKCLEKEPDRRYQTANELGDDLRRHLAGEPVRARPTSRIVRQWRWCRRHPAPVVGGAVGAIAIAALVGLLVAIDYQGDLQSARDAAIEVALRNEELAASERRERQEAERLAKEQLALVAAEREQRERAEAAEREAERARGLIDHILYAERLQTADTALTPPSIEIPRARELLDNCQEHLRGWDWRFLNALLGKFREFDLRGHEGAVRCTCFSPDGTWIASGGDKSIRMWDARSGRQVLRIPSPEVTSAIAFSPDGRRFVSSHDSFDDGAVKLWDAETGALILAMKGHRRGAKCVCFSPDGDRIASGGDDNAILVWDAKMGRQLLKIEGHHGWVGSVCFSPDGKQIASGGWDDTIRVWDATNGQEQRRMKGGNGGTVLSVSFTPDGEWIVSGGYDRTIRVWSAHTGQEALALKGHTDIVTSVVVGRDGGTVVSGSEDGTVRVWDVGFRRSVLVLADHAGDVLSVGFDAEDNRIVSGGEDRAVRVWNVLRKRETFAYRGNEAWVSGVCFNPTGDQIASVGKDGGIVCDASNGVRRVQLSKFDHGVSNVCFNPAGTHVASGIVDNSVRVWDAATGKETLALFGHHGLVSSVCFDSNGTKIVSGSRDKTARVWDALTGRELVALTGHAGYIESVCFSPDGRRIASGSTDRTIKMWDTESGEEVLTIAGHTAEVSRVCYGPDGSWIVSGDRDGTIRVWDAKTGGGTYEIDAHAGPVGNLCTSPDGSLIVSSGGAHDHRVKIWDARTGDETMTLSNLDGWVTSLCFSPDGRQIASGGEDGYVRIWSTRE